MDALELFAKFAPIVQLSLIIGCLATIFLIACSRTASANLHKLLAQLKHGDDEVLSILYPHYVREFYKHARREGLTHEDAEDAAQTTFVRILTCIGGYDEVNGGGERWMWTICNNLVTDLLRR